jgi:hypothetical protein
VKLAITHVPYGHIHEVYGHIVPFIAKAEGWTRGRLNMDDISASLFSDKVQLWLVFDSDTREVHGYLSTEIRDYPRCKQFVVLNCGGRDGSLDACVDTVFDTFEQYARDNGCDGIEIQGRAAWWKYIKDRGYASPMRSYYKKFERV